MSEPTSAKVFPDAASALRGVVKDGMTLMCGGFGLCGIPEKLISALHDSGIRTRTVVRTTPASMAPVSAFAQEPADPQDDFPHVGETRNSSGNT